MSLNIQNQYKDPELVEWITSGLVVVFDLEYTAWEGSWKRGWSEPWEHREVVQFGAVLVDAGNEFSVVDKFSRFVIPKCNSQLSDYFVDLTGITQDVVDREGGAYPNIYRDFIDFSSRAQFFYSNGLDGEVLRENCILNAIDDNIAEGRVINIRQAVAKAVSNATGQNYEFVDSGDLIKALQSDLVQTGAKHDALADAIGIATSLRDLRCRGLI